MQLKKIDASEGIEWPEKYLEYDELSAKNRIKWNKMNESINPKGQKIVGMAELCGHLYWSVSSLEKNV